MTDTTLSAPCAGWYRDPSGTASYRFWDGAHWSAETLQKPPSTDTTLASPADHRSALPSRRSLRSGQQPPRLETQIPRPAPTPYVPVNPLVSQHTTSTHPTGAAWHTPDAWVANVPARPDYAVYGTGLPFAVKPTRMPTVRATNRSARNGMALGILSVVQVLLLLAIVSYTGRLLVVWALWGVAGLIWSIVGLRKAEGWEARGLVPVGRGRAVAGIVLCSIALLVQGSESGLAFATAGPHGLGSLASLSPASGTPVTTAGSGVATGPGSPASFSGSPVVGTATATGLAYSKTRAENAIGGAYAATLKVTPTAVSCPGSVALAISVAFSCAVVVPGGVTTTARVTVVDDLGHAEVSVH